VYSLDRDQAVTRVLLIEDDEATRLLVRVNLEAAGIELRPPA
jgi:hypothetical protein